MKNEGYDQRVRLTKTMIKNAFLELLSAKNIRHISVRELCEKAQINRCDFLFALHGHLRFKRTA